jgi:hypothetical protein
MWQRVWTAEELERLTPAEQDAVFDASLVSDRDDVPAEFLARVRARLQERIAAPDSADPR